MITWTRIRTKVIVVALYFLETTPPNSKMVKHLHVSYNDIHNLIRDVTPKIAAEFNPDLMIAIGKSANFPHLH